MPRLPRASGKEVLKALQREGFQLSHIQGSHHYLRRPEIAALVVVPVHGNQPLPTGTLRSILKQAFLTTEDPIRLLES
jgi:predicted RNA binding protein YcfA (HicA-like mRNA interferase family)